MPFAITLTANVVLPYSYFAVAGNLFVTRVTPVYYINSKGHNLKPKSIRNI